MKSGGSSTRHSFATASISSSPSERTGSPRSEKTAGGSGFVEGGARGEEHRAFELPVAAAGRVFAVEVPYLRADRSRILRAAYLQACPCCDRPVKRHAIEGGAECPTSAVTSDIGANAAHREKGHSACSLAGAARRDAPPQ